MHRWGSVQAGCANFCARSLPHLGGGILLGLPEHLHKSLAHGEPSTRPPSAPF